MEVSVVGIYLLLSLLCFWGALIWGSWTLFAIGTTWAAMTVWWALWFMFVRAFQGEVEIR